MSSTEVVGSAGVEKGPQMAQTFQRLLPELRAVAKSEYAALNVDVPTTVTTVRYHLPRVRAVRPEIVAVTKLDLTLFDKLEDYTLALGHAHTLFSVAAARRSIEQLAEDAAEARKLLKKDAESAMERGHFPREAVEMITGRVGHEVLAFELLGLVQIFRQHWAKVQGRTPVTLEELDNAEVLGEQLMAAIGGREEQPETVKQAAADRLAAFTLFSRAHQFARRLIAFARYDHGDADEILPSLFANRGRRKPEVEPEPPEPAPDVPVPSPPEDGNLTAATGLQTGLQVAGSGEPAGGARLAALGEELPADASGTVGLPGVDPFKD